MFDGKDDTQFYRGSLKVANFPLTEANVITKFDLTWDSKHIPIDPRFWKDLVNWRILTSPLKEEVVGYPLWPDFKQYLDHIDQPRVMLSEDGGTVLIEWALPGECDSLSMVRWIISKDGTVLRHREPPDNEDD